MQPTLSLVNPSAPRAVVPAKHAHGTAQGPCVSASLPDALFLNQSITLAVLLPPASALSRENYEI